MRTIAQKYIDEGIDKGVEKTAINMIMQNADVKFIAKVTGYSISQIAELKNKHC